MTVLGSGSAATANVYEVSEPRAESWVSFGKHEHTDEEKMTRNGCKKAIYESVSFQIRVYNIMLT